MWATRVRAKGAAIAGASAAFGVVVTGAVLLSIHAHRPVTHYAVSVPSAHFGGGGTCYGCRPFEGLDLTDRTVGVAAQSPRETTIRGLVVTSSIFPSDLRDARVTPAGYYLEFSDGTVRYVADHAPWTALEAGLEPEWIQYILGDRGIDAE